MLESQIKAYVNNDKKSRPLNFLMQAKPGSGKSHFVKCLAKHLGESGITPVTFNMANMQSPLDLTPAIDEARTVKVNDKLPLLFLDEFDTDPANVALMLPLLWDGEITLGQRKLELGKTIIVLAGSSSDLPEAMRNARNMSIESRYEYKPAKLLDLLSRINGGEIEIPGFESSHEPESGSHEKVCTCIAILRRTFPKLTWVAAAFLKFVACVNLRYGPRSIEQLVGRIASRRDITVLGLNELRRSFPFSSADELKNDALAMHLCDENLAMGVSKLWTDCARLKHFAYLKSETVRFPEVPDQDTLEYFATTGLTLVERDSSSFRQTRVKMRST